MVETVISKISNYDCVEFKDRTLFEFEINFVLFLFNLKYKLVKLNTVYIL